MDINLTAKLGAYTKGMSPVIDDKLSLMSTNPVQNKVVTAKFNETDNIISVNETLIAQEYIDEEFTEDTPFQVKLTGTFIRNRVYKIKLDFNQVHWKSNDKQFVTIASYDANSISSTHKVDDIRLATVPVTTPTLEINYIPTTDNVVMIGFTFFFGAGTQDIHTQINEIYSGLKETVETLVAESANIMPAVETQEKEFTNTVSSTYSTLYTPYNFYKGNKYRLNLKCVTGSTSASSGNCLRIYTTTVQNSASQYRQDIINASSALNPLCGTIDDFSTNVEITEEFIATKDAAWLSSLYYGDLNTNFDIIITISRIASVQQVDNIVLGNGVVSLNKDVEPYVLQFGREISQQTVEHSFNRLNFLFFSDIHAKGDLWERICDYMDEYSDIIPFAIHGGDYVSNNLAPSSIGAILNTVGNHDCYPEGSSSPTASAETVYNVLYNSVDPVEDGWNCTFGTEPYSMYWYKDVVDAGVRIICLDQYHWTDTQKTWFADVLDDANTNEYGVITVVHTPITTNVTDIGSGFWTLDNWIVNDTYTGAMIDIREAINDFIADGGLFIIHLCGHIHSDQIGETNDDDLLQFRTQMAGYSQLWTDTNRKIGTKTYDCFNVIQIDRNLNMFKLIRVGCNTSDCLQSRTILCWDYVNKQIINNK